MRIVKVLNSLIIVLLAITLLSVDIASAQTAEDYLNKAKENADSGDYQGALRRAGIDGLRFHDLRHTAATRMIESGASIVAVSKILGHADLKTTMRYAHPEDSLKDAVERLTHSPVSNTFSKTI